MTFPPGGPARALCVAADEALAGTGDAAGTARGLFGMSLVFQVLSRDLGLGFFLVREGGCRGAQ